MAVLPNGEMTSKSVFNDHKSLVGQENKGVEAKRKYNEIKVHSQRIVVTFDTQSRMSKEAPKSEDNDPATTPVEKPESTEQSQEESAVEQPQSTEQSEEKSAVEQPQSTEQDPETTSVEKQQSPEQVHETSTVEKQESTEQALETSTVEKKESPEQATDPSSVEKQESPQQGQQTSSINAPVDQSKKSLTERVLAKHGRVPKTKQSMDDSKKESDDKVEQPSEQKSEWPLEAGPGVSDDGVEDEDGPEESDYEDDEYDNEDRKRARHARWGTVEKKNKRKQKVPDPDPYGTAFGDPSSQSITVSDPPVAPQSSTSDGGWKPAPSVLPTSSDEWQQDTGGNQDHASSSDSSPPLCIVSVADAKGLKKDSRKDMNYGVIQAADESRALFQKRVNAAKKESDLMNEKQKAAWNGQATADLDQKPIKPFCKLKVEYDNNFDYPTYKLIIRLAFTPDGVTTKELTVEHAFGARNVRKGDKAVRIRKITHRSMLDQEAYPGFPIDENFSDFELQNVTEMEIDVLGDKGQAYGEHQFLNETEYGPWTRETMQVQPFLRKNHVFRILFTDGEIEFDQCTAWYEQLQEVQTGIDGPTYFRVRNSQRDQYQKGKIIAHEKRPRELVPSRATFPYANLLVNAEYMGGLMELEYIQSLAKPIRNVQARFITYRGGMADNKCTQIALIADMRALNDRLLIAYDDDYTYNKDHAAKTRISPGDTVRIDIPLLNPNKQMAETWSGKVRHPFPGSDPGEISIILNSPIILDHSPKTHRAVDITPIQQACMHVDKELTTVSIASEKLNKLKPVLIHINLPKDEKAIKDLNRCADSINNRIIDEKSERFVQAYLAVDFATLDARDLYDEVDKDILDLSLSSFDGREEQKQAFEYVRSLPDGLGLITGPPGCGKSALLHILTRPLFLQGRTSENAPRPKFLVVSPLNKNADNLAINFLQSFMVNLPDKAPLPIVIRAYTKRTEREILLQPGKKELQAKMKAQGLPLPTGSLDQKAFDEAHGELGDIFHAHLLYNWVKEQLTKKNGLNDPRVTQAIIDQQLSLGYQILLRSGILNPEIKPEHETLQQFRQSYKNYVESDSDDQKEEFGDRIKKAADYILSIADVVVTTVSLATEQRITTNFPATHLLVDEATKVTSLQLIGLDAMLPQLKFKLMVGDPMQTKSHARTPATENIYGAQFSFPLFYRMLAAKFPHVALKQQARYGPHMCEGLSTLFYNHQLSVADAWFPGTKEQIDAQKIIMDYLGVKKTFCQVVIDGGDHILCEPTLTRKNPCTATACWLLAGIFIDESKGAYTAKDIAIITPYLGQELLHRSIQSGIASEGDKFAEYLDINITTVERDQGSEFPIVIFDTTSTSSPGIVAEQSRFIVAASRAKDFFMQVTDSKLPTNLNMKKHYKFSRVIDYFNATEASAEFLTGVEFEALPFWQYAAETTRIAPTPIKVELPQSKMTKDIPLVKKYMNQYEETKAKNGQAESVEQGVSDVAAVSEEAQAQVINKASSSTESPKTDDQPTAAPSSKSAASLAVASSSKVAQSSKVAASTNVASSQKAAKPSKSSKPSKAASSSKVVDTPKAAVSSNIASSSKKDSASKKGKSSKVTSSSKTAEPSKVAESPNIASSTNVAHSSTPDQAAQNDESSEQQWEEATGDMDTRKNRLNWSF